MDYSDKAVRVGDSVNVDFGIDNGKCFLGGGWKGSNCQFSLKLNQSLVGYKHLSNTVMESFL